MKAFLGPPQASWAQLPTFFNPTAPTLAAPLHLSPGNWPGLPAAFKCFFYSAARDDLTSNQVLSVSCLVPSTISRETWNEI